jgi:hypothetical protein
MRCAASVLRSSVSEAQSSKEQRLVKLKVDFRNLLKKADLVNVSIWHDAADDCGTLCDLNVRFLKQIAKVEKARKEPMAINVRPRFIFQDCDPGSAKNGRCAKTCTANGKCAPALPLSTPPSSGFFASLTVALLNVEDFQDVFQTTVDSSGSMLSKGTVLHSEGHPRRRDRKGRGHGADPGDRGYPLRGYDWLELFLAMRRTIPDHMACPTTTFLAPPSHFWRDPFLERQSLTSLARTAFFADKPATFQGIVATRNWTGTF